MPKRIVNNVDRVQRVRNFLADSASDYLAARVLFLHELPKQAAILASTAVEKSLKALLAVNGQESHGHLKSAHWNAGAQVDKELAGTWSREFVTLCQKVYGLRYTDNLPPGFNLVIATREFLAELDATLMGIHTRLQIHKGEQPCESMLSAMIKDRDARILTENFGLEHGDRAHFVYRKPQLIYEIRNDAPRGVVEILHWSKNPPRDSSFLRLGLIPKEGQQISYEHSHESMSYKDRA